MVHDGTGAGAMGSNNEQLVVSWRERPDQKQTLWIQGSWFPDAFGASMGELMRALAEGQEPQTSGRDNLNSIKIAYAAVESAGTGKTVELR